MSLRIRPATEGDQPTIGRFIKEAHLPRLNVHWPNFVVAEEDREIIGVGQVKSHSDGSRELASITVAPARQRAGIGAAVINALLAREAGVVLHLSCRRELESYYERFGFRRIAQAAYPPYFRRTTSLVNLITRNFGLHLVVMRREAAS
jgi:N-acetylglutamate synthase-like GNAT family acetyltransferase